MFSDFLACCWDYLANEIPKVRYMTGGQVTVPLVIRTANGGGLGFGAQHSQAVENWALTIPGLKIVAPSTPADVIGLMASAIRSDDPVVFFEHKGLFASKGPRRPRATSSSWARRPSCARAPTSRWWRSPRPCRPRSRPRERLAAEGISRRGGRPALPHPDGHRRPCSPRWRRPRAWSRSRRTRTRAAGARPSSRSWSTRASACSTPRYARVASANVPLPFADALEDEVIPTVDKVVAAVRSVVNF